MNPSKSITAEDEQIRAIDIEVQAIRLAGLTVYVSMERLRQGERIFRGKQILVFGVEPYEL